jgi:hypothetical protein
VRIFSAIAGCIHLSCSIVVAVGRSASAAITCTLAPRVRRPIRRALSAVGRRAPPRKTEAERAATGVLVAVGVRRTTWGERVGREANALIAIPHTLGEMCLGSHHNFTVVVPLSACSDAHHTALLSVSPSVLARWRIQGGSTPVRKPYERACRDVECC